MDATVIGKFRGLERCVQQLRKLQSYHYDEIESDLEKIWAIEHGLQVAIQIVIDVGNHILASMGENQIENYADVLNKLGKCHILPSQFAEKIKRMVEFRNILIYRYAEVDPGQVYDMLQNRLDDFVEYIGHVQSYFSSRR